MQTVSQDNPIKIAMSISLPGLAALKNPRGKK